MFIILNYLKKYLYFKYLVEVLSRTLVWMSEEQTQIQQIEKKIIWTLTKLIREKNFLWYFILLTLHRRTGIQLIKKL